MILEFSFDDGGIFDKKIASLLEKYGFTGTFYIPSVSELSNNVIKQIAIKHEIGGHTETHSMDLKLLSYKDLVREIGNNRKYLQEMTGQPITKFCYPRGRYNENVIDVVKEIGFTEARTTQVFKTDIPEDPFKRDTTIHVYQRNEYKGVGWQIMARTMFDIANGKGDKGYFHLWGHGLEINEYKNWNKFEKLLEYIKDNL